MNTDIEFVQKFNLAYNAMCKPLCQQLKLPQTAFDILMFFGNNPEYRTVMSWRSAGSRRTWCPSM